MFKNDSLGLARGTSFGVNYHLHCVLAFSRWNFRASRVHKVGVDGIVLLCTESVAIQTEVCTRAVFP